MRNEIDHDPCYIHQASSTIPILHFLLHILYIPWVSQCQKNCAIIRQTVAVTIYYTRNRISVMGCGGRVLLGW